MKCQMLLSRKNKKNIISLSSVEFAHGMVTQDHSPRVGILMKLNSNGIF